LACPFFMPTEPLEDGLWLHPLRLPLGGGWQGHCTAPGYEGEVPGQEQLHAACNLGYATACPRLPQERTCDAIRFSIVHVQESSITVCYVCEIAHRPGEHGRLEYRRDESRWFRSHHDPRVQRMAECFLKSYLDKTERTGSVQARDNDYE
jgi:hypothetical protein